MLNLILQLLLMKNIFSILLITTINSAFSQNMLTSLSFNFGGNITSYGKNGYQIGLTSDKLNNNFQIQYLYSGSEMKKSTNEPTNINFNVTTKLSLLSFSYGYNISNKKLTRLIPSLGIMVGKENYRTGDYEEIPNSSQGCFGGCFGGSATGPSYTLFYEEKKIIAGKLSLKFQLRSNVAWIGFGLENYYIINNNGRIDFGFAINLLFGKPKTSYNPLD